MQVRVHILRGLQKLAADDDAGAIEEYRAALALNRTSSLASYRLGEVYFSERNYQAAEEAFRSALNGDGIPKWTEVWSDLQLGKIFDVSGQRDRAVNQYREALETQDNTSGALTWLANICNTPIRRRRWLPINARIHGPAFLRNAENTLLRSWRTALLGKSLFVFESRQHVGDRGFDLEHVFADALAFFRRKRR